MSVLLATSTIVMFLLSGCAAQDGGSPSPAPSPPPMPSATVPSPSTTPEPTPEPAALVIPACDELLDTDGVAFTFGDGVVPIPDADMSADILPGPMAQAAWRGAEQSTSCMWGYPQSDGLFYVSVAELEESTSDDLIAALRDSTLWDEVDVDGAPGFVQPFENELGGGAVAYVFDGSAWIIVIGTIVTVDSSVDVAAEALASIRASNPDLG